MGEYQVTHSPGPQEGLPGGWEGAMWEQIKTSITNIRSHWGVSTHPPPQTIKGGGYFKWSPGYEENSRGVPENFKMAGLASLLGRLVGPLLTDGPRLAVAPEQCEECFCRPAPIAAAPPFFGLCSRHQVLADTASPPATSLPPPSWLP